MTVTTIVQNGVTKYKAGSQLYKTQAAADYASRRLRIASAPKIVTKGKTKQQVLDQAISTKQVTTDATTGAIKYKTGETIGNTNDFKGTDMSNTYDETTGKYVAQTPTPGGTEGNIGTPDGTIPDTTTPATPGALSGPQDAVPQETLQNNQQIVGGQVQGANVGMTKQQVLDKAIQGGGVRVDEGGNLIDTKTGKQVMNLNGIDMTQSAIGQIEPNANAPIQQQAQANQDQSQLDQNKINNIRPDQSLGLSNSPDSPFWNKFGQPAIDAENELPGFMNERNKVIASSIMLNNTTMKFMSEAKRKELILNDIMDRQEGGVDPNIEGRYKKTVDNINNLISREIPPYTSNDYFKMMLSGEKIDYIASLGDPNVRTARTRFNDLQKFSAMDSTTLADSIKSGKLNKGGQLRNDLLNKGMGEILNDAYSKYNYQSQTTVSDYITNEVSGFSTDKSLESQASIKIDLGTGLDAQISEKILDLMTNPDDAPTLGSFLAADPDVAAAKKASRATEAEINDLSDQITAFADDIKEKVVERGGEATDDPFLEIYIQEKTKPFTKKLTQLNGKYRNEIALLEDATTTATTAFEVKQYNKQMELQGYQFVLGRLDQQRAEATAKAAADQAQSNRQKSFDLQVKQFNQSQENWNKEFNIKNPPTPTPTPNTPVTPSGQLTTVKLKSASGKEITRQVDSVAGNTLSEAFTEMNKAGIKPVIGETYRTKERQQQLYDAYQSGFGGIAAKPGTSKHESGLALDLYSDSKYSPPTQNMIDIMAAKGWKHMGIKGDMGHFEYVGKPSQGFDTSGISIDQIISFNDDVSRRKMSPAQIAAIGTAKKTVMSNPDADISDILARSNGGKSIGETQSKTLLKFDQAMSQVDAITNQIKNMKTGPILGTLRGLNPYDTNANVLKAQLQGLVPTIARGIYGEVGVLTDNDIRLYSKTLPTLKGTESINKGVLAYTLDILAGGYKKQLAGLAGQGYDVSGLEGVYKNIKGQADAIKAGLGMASNTQGQSTQPSGVGGGAFSTIAPSPYSRWNP